MSASHISEGAPQPRFPRIALASVVLLVLASVAMAFFNEHLLREQRAQEASIQARVLAASVSGALAFDDDMAARDAVRALAADPALIFAGAYDDQGRLVAGQVRKGREPLPVAPAHQAIFEGGTLVVTAPVSQEGIALGTVRLQYQAEPFASRVLRYAGVAVLIGMALLVVIVLGRGQAAIRQAYEKLAQAHLRLQSETEERQKTEAVLRQSQKMEAIGQLTGGVAHDFNNLLMVASSGLELLERTDDPARRARLIDGIRQAVDRGASLTHQLLAFSRRSPTKSEVVDARTRIEGMSDLLERSLRGDIDFRLAIPPGLWPVECDESQLELSILNIAVNARDAMPSGGVITIEARNESGLADHVLVGDYVRIAIQDDGQGMDATTALRVFEPFFTTKGVGKGTGLGLSQVFGFAKSCGGDVRVESEVGQGTTVTLYLPRSTKPLADTAAPTAAAAATPAHGHILLVEDDDSVADMALQMIQGFGYSVVRAPAVQPALDLLKAGAKFDLVFSDMVMPGEMNGMDLARTIGRRYPKLPVILTTGFSEAATEAARAGFRLLAKPYRMEALQTELHAALSSVRAH